ncbi:DUF63 family protein [Methanococcoides burtonii]|uniref:DUF63 family protein n=1 Tax=Methanococcoides burtonii (strain DSM 6242 / NBRC 107633 / OCM 468 / ACE-M) TaxID=259564 RepID=Q12X60_METBU|nr:DUF63 family protein [Methanococcoides burtonii]ABE51966.1 Protein of unknown function DUF63 [Methanococcoides burtonii DSM 6242]
MCPYVDKILEFVNRYYLEPIFQDSGYNVVNTLTWALILGICVFAVAWLLEKWNVEVDDKFVFSIIPFILAGSSLRVIEDAGVFDAPLSYLFITPNIYFFVFVVTVFCLLLSRSIASSEKVSDWKVPFALLGLCWFAINIITLLVVEDITRPFILVAIVLLGTVLAGSIYLAFNRAGVSFVKDPLNMMIIWSHLLDASSTFIGVDILGYYEKHVVPAYLIDLTGTALVMFPLKLAIFLPVIYIIDTQFVADEESKRLRTFVKMVIIILGLSPACRNTIRMAFGI